jgi:uncharacterized protein (TIGR02145 family)
MSKNLDVTTYRNGDPIPKVTDMTAWASLVTGAYCYYNNDSATYASIYGKLYNWYAVNDPRGLAPEGWYIPTSFEWTTLSNCLGGDAIAGGPLKETGTGHWSAPNAGGTNVTGFYGLPGGYRSALGNFYDIGLVGHYWSASAFSSNFAYNRFLHYNNDDLGNTNNNMKIGMSIRCIRN